MNPLDQLADITAPETVSIWPLAWGYWLVIALVLSALVWAIMSIKRFRALRRKKYEALIMLNNLDKTDHYFAHKVQVIIKQLNAHYLPHSNSQIRYGDAWQALLLSVYKGNKPAELELAINTINMRLYASTNAPGVVKTADSQEALAQQNHQVLNAMKDLVNTSYPSKVSNSPAKSLPDSKKVSHA